MTAPQTRHVFLTGGTGYIGSRLAAALLSRGHQVTALVRQGSQGKLPRGCGVAIGNVLDAATYRDAIAPADTVVHLVGVPHPNPSKAQQFRDIDLASARQAIGAASACASVRHFVYLSVAHPAPMMHAYIAARMEGEACLREAVAAGRFGATVLRPWYVLGPGHRWPYLLMPLYWLAALLPGTRDQALRLWLVTLDEMVSALVRAVETPVPGIAAMNVPDIRGIKAA